MKINMRIICPICSDLYEDGNSIVAAPCGHVFHEKCLLKWINQSKTCPDCRIRVTEEKVIKLYISTVLRNESFNETVPEIEISDLKATLRAKNEELEKSRNEKQQLVYYFEKAENQVEKLKQQKYKLESENYDLLMKLNSLTKLEAKVQKLEQRNAALTNDLEHLNHVQMIVSASQQDVECILNSYGEGPGAVKQISTFCSLLKRELRKVTEAKSQLQTELASLKKDYGLATQQLKNLLRHGKVSCNSLVDVESEKFFLTKKTGNVFRGSTSTAHSSKSASEGSAHVRSPDAKVLKGAIESDIELTPISHPTSDRKRKMDLVVLDKEVNTISTPYLRHSARPVANHASRLKSKHGDSIIQTGYNGLGGHARFINRASDLPRKLKRT